MVVFLLHFSSLLLPFITASFTLSPSFLLLLLSLLLRFLFFPSPFFLATLHSIWELSSPTSDGTHVPWVLTTELPGRPPVLRFLTTCLLSDVLQSCPSGYHGTTRVLGMATSYCPFRKKLISSVGPSHPSSALSESFLMPFTLFTAWCLICQATSQGIVFSLCHF